MSYLYPPPQQWTNVIAGVISFIDPLLDDDRLSHWDPRTLRWLPDT